MKKTKKIVFLLLFFSVLTFIFSFSSFAYSEEVDFTSEKDETVSDLMKEFSEVIPSESGIILDEDDLINSIGFDRMIKSVLDSLCGKSSELLVFLVTVIGFAVLSTVSESAEFLSPQMQKNASSGVCIIMAVTTYPTVYSVFESVGKSLDSAVSFFGTALPIMTAISTASGAVKTAAVQAMNMNIILGIVGNVATEILLPLSFAMLALARVSSLNDSGVGNVAKGIKGLFTFGLGIVSAVSSAAITLQTVIASASDSAALRAARYAAGGLIPVVGSSVSSALSTLAGGLAYVKSAVGAAAIAVVSSITIAPLVLLLCYRLTFSLAADFLDYASDSGAKRCFLAYRTAFDTVIAVHVMSTLVCIIQIIVFIKGGVA